MKLGTSIYPFVALLTLSSCASLHEALSRKSFVSVLNDNSHRANVHRRLGAPSATHVIPLNGPVPEGYGSLSRRHIHAVLVDSWKIDGYTKLSPDRPNPNTKSLGGFFVEELTLGPLIEFDWSRKQRDAKYALHVAFDGTDRYVAHSRVLVDSKSLVTYPPTEE